MDESLVSSCPYALFQSLRNLFLTSSRTERNGYKIPSLSLPCRHKRTDRRKGEEGKDAAALSLVSTFPPLTNKDGLGIEREVSGETKGVTSPCSG